MIDFDTDERIIFEVRKHWLLFVTEACTICILALLPLGIFSFISLEFWQGISSYAGMVSFFVFLYSLWLLICWVMVFVFWTNYYLDVWIITNKKILNVDQHGLFKREVIVLHLDKIQDITYMIDGLVATTLNYGNIKVTTAGAEAEFIFKGIPNPALVQAKINEALLAHKKDSFKENVQIEEEVKHSKDHIDAIVEADKTTPRF
jgi:uncharacterized membrane protein YdbT with pleckstrin-like domain